MKQKIISMMAVSAMLFTANTVVPENVFADYSDTQEVRIADTEDYTYEGFSYIIEDDTVIITECGQAVTNVDIPSEIDGMRVTCIDDYAFSSCVFLKSVTIPDSITSIGDAAFRNCYRLKSVTITDSVTHLGNGVFEGCSSLESVTIGNSVTSIGESVFSGCSSLESVTIPDSVASIGQYAFKNCESLTSIVIPDGVTKIGGDAFEACNSLASITVGANNNVYSSMDGVLFDKAQSSLIFCPKGKSGSYIIPEGVTSIEEHAFDNCGIKSVTIPNSITSIGNYAFYDCYALVSIEIPDSVTSIGDNAFSDCRALMSIEIPDSVTSIGDYAFYHCYALMSVTLPDSVVNIGRYAFQRCGIASITIPDSVKSIGSGVFDLCTNLTNITVEPNNSVYSASDGVLFNKEQTSVICYPRAKSGSYIIPDSVTSIGGRAFYFCDNLTGVTIPNSVTSMEEGIFLGCRRLKSITVDSDNSVYSSVDGVLFDKAQISLICYPGGKSDSYVIPDGVTSIGKDAFCNHTILKSITIPDSVTSIEDGSFNACYYLKDVYYNGTREQWEAINIGERNSDLCDAVIHCTDDDDPIITPPAKDWEYTIKDIEVEDRQVSVSVSKNYYTGGILIVALYADNGTLIETKCTNVDAVGAHTRRFGVEMNTDRVAYVKAFMWDDMISITPISEKKVKVL